MKKYLFIFKTSIMTNLQYMLDIVFSFIGYFMMVFVFINLWKYIYSDPNELINGYSMNQMIWYVIITEILWGISKGRVFCKSIVADVKGGNIAYNINKPYNYISYVLFNHLGGALIRGIMYIIVGMLMGLVFLGSFPSLNIISILIILLTVLFATIISTLLITIIGLFSFFIEDSSTFYWIYSKLILVVGVLFPIEFFPSVVQPIIKFSPVYVVSYGPAKLFVDFTYSTALSIIGAQITYIVITYFICSLVYRKGVKNLNVNGG